ncbi:MAG: thioredoxin family protein [Polyangiaceae bacterium]
MSLKTTLALLPLLVSLGCSSSSTEAPGASGTPAPSGKPAAAAQAAAAEVGKAAPDFTLNDLDGKPVSLASFKGKTVVLEWFNPECPFVKAAHNKGSLKTYASEATDKGVVWLAVNSGAPGKQGAAVEKNREGVDKFGLKHPVLLDPTGEVGRKYGATNTPHMFVIDGEGTLVYAGAVDNSPDGEGESPEGGKLINYVDEALKALNEKKPVSVPKTPAYGCSVKYGS